MQFGISISQVDEVDLVVRAEEAGYDFCWVWDSPMIRSNLWAVMALAADRTSRIRVGSGVAIPALRMAPVTANAIATINRLLLPYLPWCRHWQHGDAGHGASPDEGG